MIQKCLPCMQVQQISPHPPKKSLWPRNTQQFQRVHLDHGERNGMKFLVCVDSYINLLSAWFVRSTQTEQTCNKLKEGFNMFGYPETIMTNNEPSFSGQLFERFCYAHNINLLHSL